MSKILIIDDEEALVMLLEDELSARGHDVLTAYDGLGGIELAKGHPDLIILDIMMPKLNGFEVCRAIRDEIYCPIIFLSGKQSESDKIKSLSLGGDDYIEKPFGLQELMAKIDAHLRREKRARYLNVEHNQINLYKGKFTLDLKERIVKINEIPVLLTKTEFDIVELLSSYRGQVFSRVQIYERIWGYDAKGDDATVVEHVKKIRSKLAALDSETEYISTVWGIGYKWKTSH